MTEVMCSFVTDPKKGQSNSYSLLKFKNTGNMRRYPERDDNCDLRAGAAGTEGPVQLQATQPFILK
ncbi:hypothetical protein CCH79_00020667 [Gambusia affinis]|uniref:Uncharacterized protein n=1 Tax=Gambusia affinis TaxID=33528 RepID=A0A315UZZ4_GAMAF|nr:hypothetical protein CCH79_00020667 [Gambusia affinis]